MTITNFVPFLFYFHEVLGVFYFVSAHYAHKLRKIYLLSALHTHERAKEGDTLFIKFFILKYGSSRSTWNNFSSSLRSLFHSASFWRWKFLLYFSIYGDICTIYLFFMISLLAKLSTEKLCRESTNNAAKVFVYNFLRCLRFFFLTKIEFPPLNFIFLGRSLKKFVVAQWYGSNFFVPLINKLSCRLEFWRIATLVPGEGKTFFPLSAQSFHKNCKIIHATLSLTRFAPAPVEFDIHSTWRTSLSLY